MRRKLKTLSIHKVVVNSEFNAAVIQAPKFSFFSTRNYLILGLPYMMASSPGEFLATLAHELGHMSRAHGRFGYWVYRASATWSTLLRTSEESERCGIELFRWFFKWYSPYFDAYTLAASRAHEFEADRLASEVTSKVVNASSLLGMEVRGYLYHNIFWDGLWDRAENEDSPPVPYTEVAPYIRATPDPDFAQNIIDRAMRQCQDPYSTHPTMAQRLKAMGVKPHIPPPIKETAVDAFLGKDTATWLTDYFDGEWKGGIRDRWQEHGETLREQTRRLRELEERVSGGEADARELLERAEIIEGRFDRKSAIEAYRKAVEADAANPVAQYSLGRLLIHYDEARGIEHLERAMQLDLEAAAPALEFISSYMRSEGRLEKALSYQERALKQKRLKEDLEQEKNSLAEGDIFTGPDLAEEDIASLKEQLSKYGQVRQAYIARKASRLVKGKYYYVLGIFPSQGEIIKHLGIFTSPDKIINHIDLRDRLSDELDFPVEASLAMLNYQSRSLRRDFLKAALRIL